MKPGSGCLSGDNAPKRAGLRPLIMRLKPYRFAGRVSIDVSGLIAAKDEDDAVLRIIEAIGLVSKGIEAFDFQFDVDNLRVKEEY